MDHQEIARRAKAIIDEFEAEGIEARDAVLILGSAQAVALLGEPPQSRALLWQKSKRATEGAVGGLLQ